MGVTKQKANEQKIERLFQENSNKQGDIMRVVEYNNSHNIIVEFQDEYKTRVKTTWQYFKKGSVINPTYKLRLGQEKYNNKGYVMKIIEYNNRNDIIVEFQDKYKGKVHTSYQKFLSGEVKNPYHPNVFGVGISGNKYSATTHKKEYIAWNGMIDRCFTEKYKNEHPTYKNATCCDEWLLFENFYEWLHSQENFDKWLDGDKWEVDKDILVKGNKLYSPDTCCLVPHNVNKLFIKNNVIRGNLPIGVSKDRRTFKSLCNNPFINSCEYLGNYNTPEEAFLSYKKRKEEIIKQVAQIEYDKSNITKKCYEAMMNYEVEITD